MIYGKDLLAQGWNVTASKSNEVMYKNEAAAGRAMKLLTSRACGDR
eukprot:SAG31_NODE_1407_length_8482_cov_11.903291_4_plen_46_part_00